MGQRPGRSSVAAITMKILDDDPFFAVDVPLLRIRRCSPAEAAARDRRWKASATRKLGGRLKANAKADRRAGQSVDAELLVPWRELAADWQRILATFYGLFETREEEEQARLAFHQGGSRWRVFFNVLIERKRDRAGLACARSFRSG